MEPRPEAEQAQARPFQGGDRRIRDEGRRSRDADRSQGARLLEDRLQAGCAWDAWGDGRRETVLEGRLADAGRERHRDGGRKLDGRAAIRPASALKMQQAEAWAPEAELYIPGAALSAA